MTDRHKLFKQICGWGGFGEILQLSRTAHSLSWDWLLRIHFQSACAAHGRGFWIKCSLFLLLFFFFFFLCLKLFLHRVNTQTIATFVSLCNRGQCTPSANHLQHQMFTLYVVNFGMVWILVESIHWAIHFGMNHTILKRSKTFLFLNWTIKGVHEKMQMEHVFIHGTHIYR